MTIPALVAPASDLSSDELERYSRHLTLGEIGAVGQRRLKNARVLVVGAGGLGSPALQYLAAAGVGTIGIVDDDRVALSNLQRQVVHGVSDLGRPKVDSAADAVSGINPHVTVRAHKVRLDADNAHRIVGLYDIVLDGADNFATRYLVSDACALAGVPCVWGTILRFEGRVSVFWPPHGPTYRDLHPEPPPAGEVPSCAEGGVLGMLPATIGAVMVTEAVKVITGTGRPLIGRVLLHDALAMTWREIGLPSDPAGHAMSGTVHPTTCTPDAVKPADRETVSPTELSEMLAARRAGDTAFALVDVREKWERDLVSIPAAVPAPLDDLLERGAAALPPEAQDADVVLYCKAGTRSARALAALRDYFVGRSRTVRHLDGGVLAWVSEVATDQPTY